MEPCGSMTPEEEGWFTTYILSCFIAGRLWNSCAFRDLPIKPAGSPGKNIETARAEATGRPRHFDPPLASAAPSSLIMQ